MDDRQQLPAEQRHFANWWTSRARCRRIRLWMASWLSPSTQTFHRPSDVLHGHQRRQHRALTPPMARSGQTRVYLEVSTALYFVWHSAIPLTRHSTVPGPSSLYLIVHFFKSLKLDLQRSGERLMPPSHRYAILDASSRHSVDQPQQPVPPKQFRIKGSKLSSSSFHLLAHIHPHSQHVLLSVRPLLHWYQIPPSIVELWHCYTS
ncbi:hypothetical protein F5I97DRAFT_945569 [Phlebopus sp. FC_14]|nr:hypothetical protein F5I97DRAFT_945569 [Phlebopus sp. FC_14]